jgi:hypothetical protein
LFHERDELLGVAGLGEVQIHARPRARVSLQELWQELCADALERPDAKHPGIAVRQTLEIGSGRLHSGCDRAGVAQEQFPCLCEMNGAPPARSLDEPDADAALERRDLLADR